MKRLLFGLSLLVGCSHPMPNVDATFWAGDSQKNGISRSQENRTIDCHQPEFDAYACITYADVKKIYATLLQCNSWGAPLASQKEIRKMLHHNNEVIQNVIHSGSESPEQSGPMD